MAVSALELKPRNAVALFDSALTLCTTSGGLWAILLPSGAVLLAALVNLADAIVARRPLVLPVLLWTAAWAVRAVAQGAACHLVEATVVGTAEPRVADSVRAALRRAPGLVTASAVMLLLNTALWLFTLGLGFIFVGAHTAGYAAIMRGEGSALNVYGTASRLLGPARHAAPWVRLMGLSQLILFLDVHLSVAALLYIARSLLGFDVTFVDRFASLDNPVWAAAAAIVTFALFEPVRAATGALLLIDGRVRQEGLDLLAQVEQLPSRGRARATAPLTALALVLLAPSAVAQERPVERLASLVDACRMSRVTVERLHTLDALGPEHTRALDRLAARLESIAYDEEDCDSAEAGLRLALQLNDEAAAAPQGDTAALVRATLERAEFHEPAGAEEPQAPGDDGSGTWLSRLWDRLMRALFEWLESLKLERKATTPLDTGAASSIMTNVVILAAVVLVVAVLALLLLRSRAKKPTGTQLDESGALAQAPMALTEGALARPTATWAGMADELAARGQFREAVRHLYLALLSRLHTDGAIDYEPTASNWDYLRGFRGPAPVKLVFRDLTSRFDFVWYGHDEVSMQAWRTFRATAEPVLASGPAGA